MAARSPSPSSGSRSVPVGLRSMLERSWEAELSSVRVHTGPQVDAVLRSRGAVGAATGGDILVASSVPEDGAAWRRIVAHEAAHVVQQARGAAGAADALDAGTGEPLLELDAEAAACAALAGRNFPRLLAVRPGREPLVQCFNAWEHMLLGDLPTDEISALATKSGSWETYAQQMVAALGLWQTNPSSVTATQVQQAKPNLQVIQLAGSQCLATRGQLNAISADYISDPNALNSLPARVIMPLLQQVRQEAYNRLRALLGVQKGPPFTNFDQRVHDYVMPGDPIALAVETSAIEAFTVQQGLVVNHYYGLLARNACHFAPFGWHRWRAFHEEARTLAASAHQASGAEKDALTAAAWVEQCYADHFLEDAFSAGHLTNKTLVMQWFVEWLASRTTWIPVEDWDSVQNVTTTNQPHLWGLGLYNLRAAIQSNDPQTAEEQSTLAARIEAAAVAAWGPLSIEEAYQQYLDFLDAASIQVSSNQVHDHFNDTGLTVKPTSQSSSGYVLYGDESLLTNANANGAAQASNAVMLSQKAVADILETGSMSVAVSDLLDLLPVSVYSGGGWMSLPDWHTNQLGDYCRQNIFGGLKPFLVGLFSASLGPVSIDQAAGGLNERWRNTLQSDIVSMLWNGERLYAGAGGQVYELDPNTGMTIASHDTGRWGETRLAATDSMLAAGVSGRVYVLDATAIGNAEKWDANLKEAPALSIVDVAWAGDCYAGSYGNAYRLDQGTGAQTGHSDLPGTGHAEVRLAAQLENGQTSLFVGTNGHVLSLDATSSALATKWDNHLSALGDVVSVLLAEEQLFAGNRGYVYELDQAAGTTLKTGNLSGTGSNEVRMAASEDTLFAASNGVVFALPRSDVSQQPLWTQTLGAGVTSVLYAGGNLFVGAAGNVWQLDPATGNKLFSNDLSGLRYKEVRMATDEVTLAVGTNGTAVGLALHPTSAQTEAGVAAVEERAVAAVS